MRMSLRHHVHKTTNVLFIKQTHKHKKKLWSNCDPELKKKKNPDIAHNNSPLTSFYAELSPNPSYVFVSEEGSEWLRNARDNTRMRTASPCGQMTTVQCSGALRPFMQWPSAECITLNTNRGT